MRPVALALALMVGACAAGSESGTSTTTTTRAVPVASTTTTPPPAPLALELADCSAPQVTFSPLCETYQLIKEWHVDGPPNPEALARAALDGLLAFQTTTVEQAPRTLICAVPDSAFEPFCNALALRVQEQSIPVGAAVEQAMIAMIDSSLDPFTFYVPPDQVGSFRANGVVGGVGVLLDANDAAGSRCAKVSPVCELTIIFVVEDNPGSEAGLKPDDVILAVDAMSVDGLGFVEAGALIAGDESGQVSLTIDRGGQILDFTIDRAQLTIPTVQVELSQTGVGYLRIPDFEADIPGLVVEALTLLDEDGYSTLVIDLRDNPGGFLDSAVAVTSEFVDGGVLLSESTETEHTEIEATTGGLANDKNLIVLVNGGTASAAEIMAAALRDDRNATIIGESTFGKNAVQLVFTLNNGGELHVAVAHWQSPSGASVEGTGLIPDKTVDLPSKMSVEDLVAIALENS